jgi:hypothetical protein
MMPKVLLIIVVPILLSQDMDGENCSQYTIKQFCSSDACHKKGNQQGAVL